MKAIKKGTGKPTRIMYSSNLSWRPLKEVLEAMLEQNLISVEKHGRRTLYTITEKGKNVLNYFHEAMELVEIS